MTVADMPLLLGAAGKSSRMGSPKHLLDFHGKPWVLWQLERFAAAGGWRVLILLPSHLPAEESRSWLARAGMMGLSVKVLRQPRLDAPMSDSLRLAARWGVVEGVGGAFWLPIDVPAPASLLWQDLVADSDTRVCEAVVPLDGGHPVWLGRYTLQRLADAPGEGRRLDELLRELEWDGRLARGRVEDPCCRLNVNTPEEWRDWVERSAGLTAPAKDGA
jgi:CTP:molybdopterin cytidylyltransferase MocA